MMKFSRGNYRVMRNCCQSGTCIKCHQVVKSQRPTRIVHTSNVSKEWAEHVVKGWPDFKPVAEEMKA